MPGDRAAAPSRYIVQGSVGKRIGKKDWGNG